MSINNNLSKIKTSTEPIHINKIEELQKTIYAQTQQIDDLQKINNSLEDKILKYESIIAENNISCYKVNNLRKEQSIIYRRTIDVQMMLMFTFILLVAWIFFGSFDK